MAVLVPTSSPQATSSVTGTRVSVVVPTRNRPEHAAACASLILATEGFVEFIMVDQSDDRATEASLSRIDDRRFRYVRTPTRGVTSARNLGIQLSTGDIVAFTDDDCRVSNDWVSRIAEVFAATPDAAVVFGRVAVPSDVMGSRYAASFEPGAREYQNTFPAADVAWGIGANMAFRRWVFDEVGMFDPLLGPGATFPAAEEYDLAIRALAAGLKVVNAKEVSVLHLGVREREAASALVRGYGMAIGAALAKHVRLGTKDGAHLLASWIGHHGKVAMRNAVRRRRPTNIGFVGSLLWGIVRSSRHRVDAARHIYRQP